MKQALEKRIATLSHGRTPFTTLVAVLLACVFILAACGGTSAPPTNSGSNSTPKAGGTLNVGLIAEPTTMDTLTSVSLYDADIISNITDALFKYDPSGTLHNQLVAGYKYDSPTVLNLTLRTGIQFQDGTPFNADAVVFNINRFLNDKVSPRYTDVVNIASVQKISDFQVQITTKKPFAPLLNVLAGAVGTMYSPTAVQSLGSKLGNSPINIGTGPFMFVEWIRGDHLLLKANPHYWKKDDKGNSLPYLAAIRYRAITNSTVMYNNLEAGQIQVASNIPPTQVATIKANPNLTYRQIITPSFGSIQLNTGSSPLDNIHVRRAIAWSINRQEIVDKVLLNVGFVAQGPLSPASWAYDKNFTGFSYDISKAKGELAQANLTNISITLLITANDPTILQEAQFLQAEMKPAGIDVSLKQETFTAAVQDFQTFNYQAFLVGWTGGYDPDATMYSMFTSKGGFNYTKYSDPQVDKLLEDGRTTVDQAQRIPLYRQAAELVVQDASRIFISHGAAYQATSKNVQNYALQPSQVLDFTSVYLN